MRVRWTEPAFESLRSHADFIANDDFEQARRLVLRVNEAVERLKQFASLGRPGRLSDSREWMVSGTPYIIAYRIRGDTLELLRILHAAQEWPEEF